MGIRSIMSITFLTSLAQRSNKMCENLVQLCYLAYHILVIFFSAHRARDEIIGRILTLCELKGDKWLSRTARLA